jgi:retron-type reverse transcriptase
MTNQVIQEDEWAAYAALVRWTALPGTCLVKKNGQLRPPGIATWTDKFLQEAIRLILEADSPGQFSPHSHRFRPERGSPSALRQMEPTGTGTKCSVQADMAQCFDRLDHQVLISILGHKLHDNRFLRLIAELLKAGYLQKWTSHPTVSGSRQGGVVSPILNNIYVDPLDEYLEQKEKVGQYNLLLHRSIAAER